jgi:hypothetical protein
VIKKLREREGHSPRWAAEPEKIIINNNLFNDSISKSGYIASNLRVVG